MISTISIPEWAPWWDRSQKGLCRLPSFCDLGSKSFCRSSMKPTTARRESLVYLSVTCSLKPGNMFAWATSSTGEYWRFCDPLFSKQISSCVICDFMCLQTKQSILFNSIKVYLGAAYRCLISNNEMANLCVAFHSSQARLHSVSPWTHTS